MEIKTIQLSLIENNEGQIPDVPRNPRLIRNAKFEALKKSIQDDPEMLELREIMVYPYKGKYIAIGGNQRLAALTDLGYNEAVCKVIDEDTSAKKLRAYILKDNYGYGENDQQILFEDWDMSELDEWGMDDIVMFDREDSVEDNIDDLFDNFDGKERTKEFTFQVTFPDEMRQQEDEIKDLIEHTFADYNVNVKRK